jgi:N-acetylneuraminate synthase
MKFIAEVSSNHSQSLDRCLKFIDVAADANCHAIKFQLFRVDKLFAPEILATSEAHQKRRAWELPLDFLPYLKERAQAKGIEFACTPFDIDAVKELVPYVDFFKIASYELLWTDLLDACAKTGKPIILSTGMATEQEIVNAVNTLKNGGCKDPILLHCTSAYPTPHSEANLAAIDTIHKLTGCEVGWSDHTANPAVIQRAVHRWGAEIIEFHLDLDGQGEEFATGHCWLPDQIKAVINDIEIAYEADGNGVKAPVPSELPDRLWRADPIDGLRPLREIRDSWNKAD